VRQIPAFLHLNHSVLITFAGDDVFQSSLKPHSNLLYQYRYRKHVKPIAFLGSSLDDLRAFPTDARREMGYQLDRVQRGLDPDDWRPMSSIGAGVREIQVRQRAGASG
jgi:hypothetical protein